MPFLPGEDRTTLLGHLARTNPQHQEITDQEVLVTLQGPHDYISPSWYTTPGVPTWNYQAVHVYGRCRVFSEQERLRELVASLTARYESSYEKPWQPDYRGSMLNAIVGVEITINDIQCKYKLSQNRSSAEKLRIAAELDKAGQQELAAALRRLK